MAIKLPACGIDTAGIRKVAWFEKEAGAERTLSPASTKVIDGWCLAGRALKRYRLKGPAFWALHDALLRLIW
ncbi:MAG: hypothetical protein IPH85_00020 [Ignavibacteria bacterium]|nr:hypothetical protein [Ignavibacteria bacterium]